MRPHIPQAEGGVGGDLFFVRQVPHLRSARWLVGIHPEHLPAPRRDSLHLAEVERVLAVLTGDDGGYGTKQPVDVVISTLVGEGVRVVGDKACGGGGELAVSIP